MKPFGASTCRVQVLGAHRRIYGPSTHAAPHAQQRLQAELEAGPGGHDGDTALRALFNALMYWMRRG